MSDLPLLKVGGDAVFTIAVRDIFATPVDAIVNPANTGLSHGGGLAEIISRMAGDSLDKECDTWIEHHGALETSDAVITTAGLLDFKAVIHAVGPRMGSGDELQKLQRTIQNVLLVAEDTNTHNTDSGVITSVAFPMISTGVYCVPKEICAQAFANVMKEYIHSDSKNKIKNTWLCVGLDDFELFTQHFDAEPHVANSDAEQTDIAEVKLDENDLSTGDNSDIDDWFN